MRRSTALIGAITLAFVGIAGIAPGAQAKPSYTQIQGTGSNWSANAVSQWITDVHSSGIQVVFSGKGSAAGRKDFTNLVTDFAVTDIGYQGKDKLTGESDTNCTSQGCRAFAYEPIVAGGTAFPYQLRIAGKLVNNLRLSGATLAKIFTNKITNWNDPAIKADNRGRVFPSLPIIPVVHAEGSGSTAQFTTYLNNQFPSLWQPFAHVKGFTEYFPPPQGGHGIAQTGSDGVMNFVSSNAANGAIGYDEYSYPKLQHFPVAKILNKAGYYTLPTQYNVAVALTHAKINMDKRSPNYLLQDLNGVYVAPEKPAYPLSSYSYFMIPTASDDPRMTTAKRQTLADYLYYSVCQGQAEMGNLGYSSLPINLVQASFSQTAKLAAADHKVDLTKRNVASCNNPTFVKGHPEINRLAQIAPMPPACDRQGAGPCGDTGSSPGVDPGRGSGRTSGGSGGGAAGGGSAAGGSGGAAGGSGGSGSGGGAVVGATTGGGSGSTAAAGAGGHIDPETGQLVSDTGSGAGSGGSGSTPQPAELASQRTAGLTSTLGGVVVAEIIAVIVGPPAVYFYLRRRRRAGA